MLRSSITMAATQEVKHDTIYMNYTASCADEIEFKSPNLMRGITYHRNRVGNKTVAEGILLIDGEEVKIYEGDPIVQEIIDNTRYNIKYWMENKERLIKIDDDMRDMGYNYGKMENLNDPDVDEAFDENFNEIRDKILLTSENVREKLAPFTWHDDDMSLCQHFKIEVREFRERLG